jgi:hypothetical protein
VSSTIFSQKFSQVQTKLKVEVLNYGSVYQLENPVDMTVYHQCYFKTLNPLGNFTKKYMLSAPPVTFTIPTFSSDCLLIETLDWANGTAIIANPYFTFSLFSTYSW